MGLQICILLWEAVYFFRRLANQLFFILLSPETLMVFQRHVYRRKVSLYCDREHVERGLSDYEEAFIQKHLPRLYDSSTQGNHGGVPLLPDSSTSRPPRILLLFCGGGREAIALSKKGCAVTAVDSVPEMIEGARRNALAQGVSIDFRVLDVRCLTLGLKGPFDSIMIFAAMYSSLPGKDQRIAFLKSLDRLLGEEGRIILSFSYGAVGKGEKSSGRGGPFSLKTMLRKLRPRTYQEGDVFLGGDFFVHTFETKEELAGECSAAGYEVIGKTFEKLPPLVCLKKDIANF